MPSIPTSALATSLLVAGLAACSSTAEPSPEPEVREATAAATEAPPGAAQRADVTTLVYQVEIAAPVATVWDTMLDPEGYAEWTRPFGAGGYFEGNWVEGERMRFLGPGNTGMVSRIAANRLHQHVTIEHLGYVMDGVEDTSSPAVTSWAPAFETYRFAPVPAGTEVTVELDVQAGYEAPMNQIWPKSLALLKALCEGDTP